MSGEHRPDLHRLGRVIRERRQRRGLTQQQLGDDLGWAQERVSLLESGRYGLPSLPMLDRLARALQIPLADVLHALGYPVSEGHCREHDEKGE